MHRRTPLLLVAGLLAVMSLVASGCGDDEEDAATTSSTPAAEPAEPAEPCSDVYVPGDSVEGPDQIEARGEPEMVACDPQGSGLEMIDEITGSGAEVPEGATVTVQYTGVDASTGTVFDSSWSRGEAISFGLDQVIPGWTEGMVGMLEGGRRTLVIPPDLAYGNGGPAPGDYLVFTIDLVSVDGGGATASTVPAGPSTTVAG